MKTPGSCKLITKVAATTEAAMNASTGPRFRFTDLLMRSPEINPKGRLRTEIAKNDNAFGKATMSS